MSEEPNEPTKWCNRCERNLPWTEFYRRKSGALCGYCKKCHNRTSWQSQKRREALATDSKPKRRQYLAWRRKQDKLVRDRLAARQAEDVAANLLDLTKKAEDHVKRSRNK